jgi:multimeric flavodoxin WrbA
MLCDLHIDPCADNASRQVRPAAEERLEEQLDRVWAADGLILATPIYFRNVSAQMKAFMDCTNDRFMSEQYLTPKAVGLLVIGGHDDFTETVQALTGYLDSVAPSHPPIEVATSHANATGEARQSPEVRQATLAMAAPMAAILMG